MFQKVIDKSSILTIVVIIVVLCVAGYFTYTTLSEKKDARDAEALTTLSDKSGITYTNLEGESASLDTYAGEVRIVNSWATWSPFSKNELNNLNQLAAEYADQNVTVLAINRMEDKERAKSFISKFGPFEHIHIILDSEDAFYKKVDGFAVPETIFYDANGHIVFHKRGDMQLDEMKKYTEMAIEASK